MRVSVVPASAQTNKEAIAALLAHASSPTVVGFYRNLDKVPSEFKAHAGFEARYGDLHDKTTLDFSGSDAVLVLSPPRLDGSDYVQHAKEIASNIRAAIENAHSVRKIVYMSSMGAQYSEGVVS